MRKLTSIASFLVLTIAVIGCSNTGKEAATSTPAGTAAASTDKPAQKKAEKVVVIRENFGLQKNTPMEDKVHDVIQAATGADVEMLFVPGDQLANKINLMLSSKEKLDIITGLTVNRAIELYKSGAIIPLNDLIDKAAPDLKNNINPALWPQVTVDGKIIGIPAENNVGAGFVMQLRTDWLKTLNLQPPKTIAEYENVLDAFINKDPDQNGKKDTIGLYPIGLDGLDNSFAPYFLKSGMAWYLNADGKLTPPELDPDYKQLLAKLAEWYKKGYIWRDFLTAKNEQGQEIVAQNKVGSYAGWYSYILSGYEKLLQQVPDANYEPILLQGTGSNKLFTRSVLTGVVAINKASTSQEAALKVLAYHATPEGRRTIYYGIQGESYTLNPDGTIDFIGPSKTDDKLASYYAKYYMYDKAYKTNTLPLNTWAHKTYTKYINKLNEFPHFEGVDMNVTYDNSKFKSFTKLTNLDTYLKEQKTRIITGETPVDKWDELMKTWLDMGGKEFIEDKNVQFNQATKK